MLRALQAALCKAIPAHDHCNFEAIYRKISGYHRYFGQPRTKRDVCNFTEDRQAFERLGWTVDYRSKMRPGG